jgi:hypothetical protein
MVLFAVGVRGYAPPVLEQVAVQLVVGFMLISRVGWRAVTFAIVGGMLSVGSCFGLVTLM